MRRVTISRPRQSRQTGYGNVDFKGYMTGMERKRFAPRQLLRSDAAAHDERSLAHSELNDHDNGEYSARPNRNSLKKLKKNRTYVHSSIVQRSSGKREITIRIGLPCSESPRRYLRLHRPTDLPSRPVFGVRSLWDIPFGDRHETSCGVVAVGCLHPCTVDPRERSTGKP